jgi:hypothetical protein
MELKEVLQILLDNDFLPIMRGNKGEVIDYEMYGRKAKILPIDIRECNGYSDKLNATIYLSLDYTPLYYEVCFYGENEAREIFTTTDITCYIKYLQDILDSIVTLKQMIKEMFKDYNLIDRETLTDEEWDKIID